MFIKETSTEILKILGLIHDKLVKVSNTSAKIIEIDYTSFIFL